MCGPGHASEGGGGLKGYNTLTVLVESDNVGNYGWSLIGNNSEI